MAIYDTMRYIKPAVSDLRGPRGQHGRIAPCGRSRRQDSPPELQDNDPSAFGRSSGATEIKIHAKEILYTRERLNGILSKHTKQPLDVIEKDTDRDYFMSAEEALKYGIVDKIIEKR